MPFLPVGLGADQSLGLEHASPCSSLTWNSSVSISVRLCLTNLPDVGPSLFSFLLDLYCKKYLFHLFIGLIGLPR